MSKIKLFIEKQEVELPENGITFSVNKIFENTTDPTQIVNDFTKSVSIPFTAKNNKLFGHIYNPDMAITEGGTTGLYFDPTKKLDFRLEYLDLNIMSGYAKMNNITKKNGTGEYNITLFGTIGKLFQEMKKITFDKSYPEENYIIDGSRYVDTIINKELVKEMWETANQSEYDISDADVKDIIGFAPSDCYDDIFDYQTFQLSSQKSKLFKDVLDERESWLKLGIDTETIIPDGLTPRGLGEYRSYLQQPYIYFNKLFQMFQIKAEEITGYQFNLDNTWFNQNNPYWYKLIFMLNKLRDNEQIQQYFNNYIFKPEAADYAFGDWMLNTTYTSWTTQEFMVKTVNYENKPIYNSVGRYFRNEGNLEVFAFNVDVKLTTYAMSATDNTKIKKNNALIMEFYENTYDFDDVLISSYPYKVMLVADDTTLNPADYPDYDFITVGPAVGPDDNDYTSIPLKLSASRKDGKKIDFSVKTKWLLNEFPLRNTSSKGEIVLFSNKNTTYANASITEGLKKSDCEFTFNDLWNNEHNLFDEILNYCKMFRILIFADDVNKQIKFIPSIRYFQNYTISKWDDKVDLSKDMVINPLVFDNKYIKFSYKKDDTKLGNEYNNIFGYNFGEKKIDTNYNFNTETKQLFGKSNTSLINTNNILSWTNLYDNSQIIYSFPAEKSITIADSEFKNKNCFGAYYFKNGLANWDTSENLHLRQVSLSDDTIFQQAYNTYFYSQDYNSVNVNTYPDIDIINGNNACTFAIPMKNYTYLNNYEGKKDIYTNFWQKWMEERYNIQNKIVTCYVKLSLSDFLNFEFNKFVIIQNKLYMVNKIYDYNLGTNDTTKVELITIQDINNYTSNNF